MWNLFQNKSSIQTIVLYLFHVYWFGLLLHNIVFCCLTTTGLHKTGFGNLFRFTLHLTPDNVPYQSYRQL